MRMAPCRRDRLLPRVRRAHVLPRFRASGDDDCIARFRLGSRGCALLPRFAGGLPPVAGANRRASRDARRHHLCARGGSTSRALPPWPESLPHHAHLHGAGGARSAPDPAFARDAARDRRAEPEAGAEALVRFRSWADVSSPNNGCKRSPRKIPALAAILARPAPIMPGRTGRLLFAIAVPVALLVLLSQTSVLEAAVAQLPPSMKRIVRGSPELRYRAACPRPRRPALDRRARIRARGAAINCGPRPNRIRCAAAAQPIFPE